MERRSKESIWSGVVNFHSFRPIWPSFHGELRRSPTSVTVANVQASSFKLQALSSQKDLARIQVADDITLPMYVIGPASSRHIGWVQSHRTLLGR